nr:cilia- and flagella-associated protein 61 isoform X2 [Misgurnus anguillicaudatus]
MSTIRSSGGKVLSVTVRRAESSDAEEINNLISPSTIDVFGRVNVIHLLERSNLSVTLSTSENAVLAHACFSDQPTEELVDQSRWEKSLHKTFTPLNTLYLHLFVSQPDFSIGGAKEIIRTVFNAIVDLEHICLMTSYKGTLDSALEKIFDPMTCVLEESSKAYVCHRNNHCPRLHVRRARVEDHDDIMQIFTDDIRPLVETHGPYFISELIESHDQEHHAVVCENEGSVVGFCSVSGHVDLKLLNQCFELGAFEELKKRNPVEQTEKPKASEEENLTAETPVEVKDSEPKMKSQGELNTEEEMRSEHRKTPDRSQSEHHELCVKDSLISCEDSDSDGSPNAFCIQLFTMEKRFEMRSADLLPYLFKLFPDREYCVISVPKLVPEFPLLQSFIRIIPHESSTFPHELYLCHHSNLFRTLEVCVAVSSDIPAVQRLIESFSQQKSISDDLDLFLEARKDLDGTALQAFVCQVESQVVGLIIIRDEEDIEFIRAHFDIERFMYFNHHQREDHGRLCHFILNPIYQPHARHFFKEVLRLSHKSCLYYSIYPAQNRHKITSHSLTAVLNVMVPVSPRRQIIYPLEELGINAPSRHIITGKQDDFALYHTNRKLSMEPKVIINARIVVVGASDTGLAFLEALTFSPHLRFNNLTLISTHGLPELGTAPDYMRFLTTSHCYNDRDHIQLSFRSWISVVMGKMKAIDRKAKHVELMSDHRVKYDYLILTTGLQYQMPSLTSMDTSNQTTSAQNQYTRPIPSNLFTLNDHHDCANIYRWIMDNFINQTGDAVVYGSTIDVYTCVEMLIYLGVSGERVHVVHPPENTQSPCFHDSAVELAVKRALEKEKVNVHYNCLMAQINDGQPQDPITSVSFITDGPPLRLECAVVFNFSSKTVDRDAFRAINDACLVFDGHLVIDSTFHTNDPSIYAAGPLTKYSRRYHADRWNASSFNSKEVGQSLASVVLPLFDPTVERPESPPPDQDHLIPIYSQAKTQGGRLPKGYYYLHITKPTASNLTSQSDRPGGDDIVTGDTETGNYFHLHLNRYDAVESITCLSKNPLPVSNLQCLYGKHQRLLNHLRSRYQQGLIRDMYSYFQENWCLALYHDRFTDFEQEVRQIMNSAKTESDHGLVSMEEIFHQMMEDKAETGGMMNLSEMFQKSQCCFTLKKTLLDYLKYNRYHLTMYARPGLL